MFRIVIEKYFGTHNWSLLFLVLFHIREQLSHQQIVIDKPKVCISINFDYHGYMFEFLLLLSPINWYANMLKAA